jgi:protoporphyrinogen IX oxidase
MIATILVGGGLVSTPGLVDWHQFYMPAKLVLVLLLAAYHGLCARWVRHFAADRNSHSARFYRAVNEIPALIMVLIVILIVVKPF